MCFPSFRAHNYNTVDLTQLLSRLPRRRDMANIPSADEDGFLQPNQLHLLDLRNVSERHVQIIIPSFEHARVISHSCFNYDFLVD